MGNIVFSYKESLKRFINSILFSVAGLVATWKHEEAFRQEVIVFMVAMPLAVWLSKNKLEVLLLMGSIVLVLVGELLNSAIESVVDRAGVEYHDLAKRAKDMGSAAVMLLILLALATWFLIIF